MPIRPVCVFTLRSLAQSESTCVLFGDTSSMDSVVMECKRMRSSLPLNDPRYHCFRFTFASVMMTTLPIATYCTADTATSNSHADKQAESGGLFLCLRQYEVSSDKATAPLPVYDTDTIRNATSPTTSPEYGWVGVAGEHAHHASR